MASDQVSLAGLFGPACGCSTTVMPVLAARSSSALRTFVVLPSLTGTPLAALRETKPA